MLRLVVVVLSFLSCSSYAYFVTIDANAEQCFFDRAKPGDRLTLFFEVSEGGFYDINVKLTAPDGSTLYKIEKESSGHYSFTANTEGKYTYCFNNKMSTVTPKTVLFALEKGSQKLGKEEGIAPEQSKLIDMVDELSNAVLNAKHEMEYLEVRENLHRAINENTNSRVVMWAAFEAVIIVGMSLGQVYYLKRFFEVRRMV
ncbi:transmembrane emp24 domain containing protein [Echinococcus multilocularis]|uniref:Transmembrane emp24 domain containing protein n=1 Tax=Echinococcus multilocularis TaxID=6211 RepID=A0A068Y1F0_ECHMU|nr:transmembrane emp24 domain containing protein [Echinococcus multilocularis]